MKTHKHLIKAQPEEEDSPCKVGESRSGLKLRNKESATGLSALNIDKEKEFDDKARDKNNLLLMRAKKPIYRSYAKTCSLEFDGRVQLPSKKNVQIEYKSRVDNRCRIVLQHGAQQHIKTEMYRGKVYSLDFTYPFSPL
jgi:hypothetical protein